MDLNGAGEGCVEIFERRGVQVSDMIPEVVGFILVRNVSKSSQWIRMTVLRTWIHAL